MSRVVTVDFQTLGVLAVLEWSLHRPGRGAGGGREPARLRPSRPGALGRQRLPLGSGISSVPSWGCEGPLDEGLGLRFGWGESL